MPRLLYGAIPERKLMIVIRDQTLTGMDVPWISAVALFDTSETEFFSDLDDAAGVERIGNGYGTSKR